MKKNHNKQIRNAIAIIVTLFMIILISPSLYLIATYYNLPDTAQTLANTFVIDDGSEKLCLETTIEGLITVPSVLKTKIAIDNEIVPFYQLSIYQTNSSARGGLNDLYMSIDVVCVEQSFKDGEHSLSIAINRDLVNTYLLETQFFVDDGRIYALDY